MVDTRLPAYLSDLLHERADSDQYGLKVVLDPGCSWLCVKLSALRNCVNSAASAVCASDYRASNGRGLVVRTLDSEHKGPRFRLSGK